MAENIKTSETPKDVGKSDEVSFKKPKNILLIENKPNQTALLHLNIYVYLNGKLEVVKNVGNVTSFHEKINTYDLIITRNEIYGYNLVQQINDLLQEKKLKTPMLVINSAVNNSSLAPSTAPTSTSTPSPAATSSAKNTTEDQTMEIVTEPIELKKVLKKSADLLKITSKAMAEMILPTYFSIPSFFLQYLQYAPCDIFKKDPQTGSSDFTLLFANGTQLDDEQVSLTISSEPALYILSQYRLKFVNNFSEQLRFSSVENETQEVVTKEKIFYANKQMDKISTKLKDVGVDQEVIDMSQINIARLIEIAKNATDLSKLINVLLSNDNSFRLKESQLLTYMTFHVLKLLNMWTEKKMQALTYASFFHDILLDDNLATVRSEHDMKQKKCTPQQISAIDNHAGVITTVVKKILPTVSNETLAIIREHHGSISGRGFCDEISSFTPLSKIFFLTQKWVFKVLTTEEKNIQHQSLIKDLKKDFSDNMSVKIIDALALVEVNEILHALTGDLQEKEDPTLSKENVVGSVVDDLVTVAGGKDEEPKLEAVVGDSSLTGIASSVNVISGVFQDDNFKKHISSSNVDDFKQLSFFVAGLEHLPDSDKIEVITGVTMVLQDNVQKVASLKNLNPEDENAKTVIKSITQSIKDAVTVVKGKFADNIDELIKVRSKNSKTLLMVAAQLGCLENAKLLVENGADIKAKDSLGKTPLHYAAMGGNLDIVNIFTNLGSGINAMDSKRRTPIVMAINHHHHKIFDFLVQREAHLNLKMDQGMDLIMFSASVGNLYTLSKLANLKIPLNSQDYKGRNAYFFAKSKGHKEVMAYLQANIKGLN
ncbi:MAG: ankyrin repeat domain-containing protein [Oligoflexia bacterium]|nr:ankyrin repeat domain-containing protein [Oligoflexia bacterium]